MLPRSFYSCSKKFSDSKTPTRLRSWSSGTTPVAAMYNLQARAPKTPASLPSCSARLLIRAKLVLTVLSFTALTSVRSSSSIKIIRFRISSKRRFSLRFLMMLFVRLFIILSKTAKYLPVAACFACCGIVARRKHLAGVWALICARAACYSLVNVSQCLPT